MQWSDSVNAGFSHTDPWLPVPPTFKAHKVAGRQNSRSGSILQFYKHVLALRHQEPALLDGKYIPLNEDQPNVLSYLRRYQDQTVLVVLNMSGEKQKVSFDFNEAGIVRSQGDDPGHNIECAS